MVPGAFAVAKAIGVGLPLRFPKNGGPIGAEVEAHGKAAVRAAAKRSKGPISANFATGEERSYLVWTAGSLLAFPTVAQ